MLRLLGIPHGSLDANPSAFLQREAHLQNETIRLRRVKSEGDSDSGAFFVPDTPTLDWVMEGPSEQFVRSVFRWVLHDGMGCAAGASHGYVLDIGANEGFYGLQAAHWGCKVYFFEPQPGCVARIQAALLINGFATNTARLIPQPVSSTQASIQVKPTSECHGEFFGVDQVHYSLKRAPAVRRSRPFDRVNTTAVRSVDLNVLFSETDHLQLIKIDVEGAEIDVLGALLPFIRRGQVQNLIVEMTPGWWRPMHTMAGATRLLQELELHNFSAVTQAQPSRAIPASELVGFIQSRRPRAQQDVWFQRDREASRAIP